LSLQCKRALGGFILAELALEHVGKVYRNGYEAIHDFSLEIKEGEFLILVGPSGCGKSTLLRQLKTVLAPHGRRSGQILIY
jgi:ABC-type sugar transport system ATPase subunit